ncbi:hypothetical protein ES707_16148 [subsurface metagenome]
MKLNDTEKNVLLTVKDISQILDVSTGCVDSWTRDGRLKCFRLGKLKRIEPTELLRYLKNVGNSEIAMYWFEDNIRRYIKYHKKARR